jgi:hypothetical protein
MADVKKGALVWDGSQFSYFKEIIGTIIYVCGSPEELEIENGPHRAYGLNGNPFWVIPDDRKDDVLIAAAEYNAAKAVLDGMMADFIKL